MRVLKGSGEAVSADGTHLGHNLPDLKGARAGERRDACNYPFFFRAKRKIVRVPMAHTKKRHGQNATPANHQKTCDPTPTPSEKGGAPDH